MSDTITVGNGVFGLIFDARSGSLVGIEDRVRGKDLLGDPARGKLLRVVCPDEIWLSRYADSDASGEPDIRSSEDELVLTCPRGCIVEDSMR